MDRRAVDSEILAREHSRRINELDRDDERCSIHDWRSESEKQAMSARIPREAFDVQDVVAGTPFGAAQLGYVRGEPRLQSLDALHAIGASSRRIEVESDEAIAVESSLLGLRAHHVDVMAVGRDALGV